jgi:DNA-binding response OmpR family regulator
MSGAILIVESDAALAQSLHDGLAALGYTVELALHGGDGLMLASLSRPDVVILDVDLCDRPGLEVMHQLHAIDASIAVIMLDDSADDAARRVALKAGAFDSLRKPVEAGELARVVAAASEGSRPGVVVPFRNERRPSTAAPFDSPEQPCAACNQAISDLSRAVGYKRALFHPECWLQRRKQRAIVKPR